jgi:hypothetical protein
MKNFIMPLRALHLRED